VGRCVGGASSAEERPPAERGGPLGTGRRGAHVGQAGQQLLQVAQPRLQRLVRTRLPRLPHDCQRARARHARLRRGVWVLHAQRRRAVWRTGESSRRAALVECRSPVTDSVWTVQANRVKATSTCSRATRLAAHLCRQQKIGGAAGTGRRQRTPLQSSRSTEVEVHTLQARSMLGGSRALEQRASAHDACPHAGHAVPVLPSAAQQFDGAQPRPYMCTPVAVAFFKTCEDVREAPPATLGSSAKQAHCKQPN